MRNAFKCGLIFPDVIIIYKLAIETIVQDKDFKAQISLLIANNKWMTFWVSLADFDLLNELQLTT